ncbi:MAG TPA: thioredoxin [Actinobacteria bacterium]|nr:thioredoxin [Actinomycetota bacterium]
MSLATTTDATFERDVLLSDLPVLVEFTAAWCPPCRMIAPVLDQIATEESKRLKVLAIDTDMNSETMLRYHVMSLPTLALFKNGSVVSQTVGARPKAAILREIEPYLGAMST